MDHVCSNSAAGNFQQLLPDLSDSLREYVKKNLNSPAANSAFFSQNIFSSQQNFFSSKNHSFQAILVLKHIYLYVNVKQNSHTIAMSIDPPPLPVPNIDFFDPYIFLGAKILYN